nr:immunoglobulin heavy chain junction region [Macaca mulatta]MOW20382.1 immunoglobulin heavy chain junction region [Macaca mulatta]
CVRLVYSNYCDYW